jgi:hypothetical protein
MDAPKPWTGSIIDERGIDILGHADHPASTAELGVRRGGTTATDCTTCVPCGLGAAMKTSSPRAAAWMNSRRCVLASSAVV